MNDPLATIQACIDTITQSQKFDMQLLCSAPDRQFPSAKGRIAIPGPCMAVEKVLLTGISLTVHKKKNHPVCGECPDFASCEVSAAIFSPVQSSLAHAAVVVTTPKNAENALWFEENLEQVGEYVFAQCELIRSSLRAEQASKEAQLVKKEISAFLSLSTEPLLVLNADGLIVEANQVFCNLLQRSRFQLLGTSIAEFLSAADWKALKQGSDTEAILVKVNPQKANLVKTWRLRTKHIYDAGKLHSVLIQIQEARDGGRKEKPEKRSLHTFEDIKGNSPAIRAAKEMAKRIAQSDTTIMIRGESGTGKEVFAQAIHSLSERSAGPFVAINCAAIPESLLESELFGYEGGAFTGARGEGKAGRFELAHGGTIFLDEIGDMSLHLQAKLLRVVQEKKVERIGGSASLKVDVRIVAATHRNLERLVAEEKFREDLYYRLNVIPLLIPPLRERKEDIPVLIEYFMKTLAKALKRPPKHLSTQVLEKLLNYHWPGNIRELENVVEHFVQLEIGDLVTLHSLPPQIRDYSLSNSSPARRVTRQPVSRQEKEMIIELLDQLGRDTNGKRKVAEKLGISLPTLYRKLQKWKIR